MAKRQKATTRVKAKTPVREVQTESEAVSLPGQPLPVVVPDGISDLATAERKLFEAMMVPGSAKLSVTQLCEAAGINRPYYYRLIAKPEVADRLRSLALQLAADVLGPVVEALKESAQILGKDGHPDRKLLLEMTGVHIPTRHQVTEQVTTMREEDPATWTEERIVRHYKENRIPEAGWPAVLLARYKAGKIKYVEATEVSRG